MTGIVSIDYESRGREYRLAEPYRGDGARVTYVGMRSMPVECSACRLAFRGGSPVVVAGALVLHPRCAIKAHVLTPLTLERRYQIAVTDA